MAFYVDSTHKYLQKTNEPEGSVWRYYYKPGNTCPASGIYRCTNCGDEVTCNKDDPLPPQNHRQHNVPGDIQWELVVMTKTK